MTTRAPVLLQHRETCAVGEAVGLVLRHMRFLSVKPVGAWRNGRARALGVSRAYAV
jgi:hypothetical protein